MKVIVRSLVLAVLLLVAWNFIAPRLLPPGALGDPAESELMRNLVRADQALRADPPPRAVLIGTSMSERFEDVPGIRNMAMSGCNPLTGLAVLHEAGLAPGVLLIEANIFPGDVSHVVYDQLFGTVPWRLRHALPALGFSYRPVTLLVNGVRWRLLGGRAGGAAATGDGPGQGAADPAAAAPGVSPELFEKLLEEEEAKDRAPLGPADLATMDDARRMIADLAARGTEIIFFEVPMHPRIAATPRYESRRAILREAFPPGEYHWVLPADEPYVTTDGVHLDHASSMRFRRHLIDAARGIAPGAFTPATR